MNYYIQQQFGYYNTSTVVEIKMPAVTRAMVDDPLQNSEIYKDLTEELSKIGAIKSLIFPKTQDQMQTTTVKASAIGKAYIEFEEVTSSFTCYNLLNGKAFMGKPVEINFYSKDLYLTKSLS